MSESKPNISQQVRLCGSASTSTGLAEHDGFRLVSRTAAAAWLQPSICPLGRNGHPYYVTRGASLEAPRTRAQTATCAMQSLNSFGGISMVVEVDEGEPTPFARHAISWHRHARNRAIPVSTAA